MSKSRRAAKSRSTRRPVQARLGEAPLKSMASLLCDGGVHDDREFDAIVIGSGAGGGILAHHLSSRGADVLLLEKGDFLFPTHIANLPRSHRTDGELTNVWDLYDRRLKTRNAISITADYVGGEAAFLGGKTLVWGGTTPRMRDWEFQSWPDDVRRDLKQSYYCKAEKLLGVNMAVNRDAPAGHVGTLLRSVKAILGRDAMGCVSPVALGRAQPPALSPGVFSSADLLMETLLSESPDSRSRKLTLLLGHQSLRFSPKKSLDRGGPHEIDSVMVYDRLAGKKRRFRAKCYVSAAGTVESTRLLLNSGIASPSGKIGVGITDHAIDYCRFSIPSSSPFYHPKTACKLLFQHRRSAHDRHPYNILLGIGSDLYLSRCRDPRFEQYYGEMRRGKMLCEIVFLHSAELDDKNRLLLPDRPDSDLMRMTIHPCEVSDETRAETEATARRIIEHLAGKPPGQEQIELVSAPLGNVAHEVGTLRMADSAMLGVVNENLRVHGYSNLFVCDLSMFPSSPAANPTLTLAALSMRLGDHLLERLQHDAHKSVT